MNPKALAPTNPTIPPPSTTIKPSSSFAFIEPKDLSSLINNSSALIIDIRPHAAYSSARIPTALSLSVPSTLLKRPLFSLDRLGAMLPSSSSRSRFSEWPKFSTILVYDVDSTGSPFLPEGSNILGLLRKFSNDAAYSGSTLLWLKGGFQRVWRECRDLVDFRPPDPEAEEDTNESGSLKTAHLSSKAFGSGTTTRNSLDMFSPHKRPPSTLSLRSNAPQMSDKINVTSSIPFNPFFDTIRQNIELTQGITERIPLRLPKRVRKRINDLPFEWLREISRRADRYSARHRSTDPAPKHLDPPPPDQTLLEQGMEALAQQFFHIELAEQKRLMGVMKHHSAESDKFKRTAIFPYSITAGVEKGAKNRYRHIWPFEHARVRLHLRRHSPPRKEEQEDHDDYVNASYVQPLCTTRRYIATQGPLEATFVDFWTLVYQQNVHVIVMLTREIEGSMVKCGPYWKDEVFGPLRLKLISVEGNDRDPEASGFFFNAPTSMPDTKTKKVSKNPADAIIKRTFLLSHTGYPDIPPRKVVQFQYLEWPDMNVPDDPRGVLGLIREVDQAVTEAMHLNGQGEKENEAEYETEGIPNDESLNRFTGIANNAVGRKHSPVLLHCSAGVGRTGGFIAVDAVLDGLRRELRKKKKLGRHHRFGHHVTGSLPHGESALTSSTGTSFSSLQSLSGSAVPQSTISQVKDGDQLPARNVRGEEARVRTWSAPSARFSQSETDQLHGLRHSASPFTSSPLVMGERSRAVEKSPSPVPHFSSMMDHDDSASLPPLSRSLSPSNRPNSSLTVDNQLSSSTMDSSREGMAEPSSMLPDEPQAFSVSAKNLTLPTSHPNLAANSTPSVNVIRTPTTNGTSLQSRSGTLSGDAIPKPTHNQGTRMQDVDQQILASRNGDPHSSPDLSYPRPLHNDQSPQALSSLDEPLMEVLQDMREQRMSLCQSLRQYVFVHAAVIEGALMIVDEEREREKKAMGMDIDDSPFINQSAGTQSVPEASSLSSPKRPRLRSKDAESSASAPSTGKRLASPTELPKEDRKGDQMLFKRPSIKKKTIDLPIKNPQEMT
ncbi:protein-tyrosine-phosphatase [Lentinula raphanica]|nr:protein-tyrosine-phosphatase [Lentinula raphanica]